jgi:hypothetical protein
MVARLESDIGGRPLSWNPFFFRIGDCCLFCVQVTQVVMPPFCDYFAILR